MNLILISYLLVAKHGEINQQFVKYILSAKNFSLIEIIASYGESVKNSCACKWFVLIDYASK